MDYLNHALGLLRAGERLIAADAFEDAGRPQTAKVLRDPGMPPVVLCGDRVYTMQNGGQLRGRNDVLLCEAEGPVQWASYLKDGPRQRRWRSGTRSREWKNRRAKLSKLHNLLVSHLFLWLWWRAYLREENPKKTAKWQRCQPHVRNEYVLVLDGPEATEFDKAFAPSDVSATG